MTQIITNSTAKPISQVAAHPSNARYFLILNPWTYVFLSCLLLLALFSTRKIETYDLGFHLKAGSWIVQNLSFPSKDTFTYTQNGQDYLDSHWLFQILLYFFQTTLGYPFLTLLNVVVLLLVFLVMTRRMRLAGASPPWICFFFLAAILASERRFIVRPEVFSWLFLGLTLLILEFREKNRNYLYWLPLIQLIWVNMEGLFILGWAALLVHAIGGYLHRQKLDKSLIRAGILSIAADLVNPYFFKGVAFPFVLWTRLQGSDLHKQTIGEFASFLKSLSFLGQHDDSGLHLFVFLLLALAILLFSALTWRKRKFHEIVLTVVFGYLAFTAIRNIPLFILVALPYLPAMLRDCFDGKEEAVWRPKLIPYIFLFLVLSLSARVATNAYYISDRRVDRIGFGLGEMCLPQEAARFLNENHLDGRMLNSLDCGGWLDWKAPQPTFIDGRLEVPGNDFYRDYTDSYKPGGLQSLIARYHPQLVLLDYNACEPWVEQLQRDPEWRLIYLDTCAAIFAYKDYALQLHPINLFSLTHTLGISILPDDEISTLVKQINPNRLGKWISGFYQPQIYPLGLLGLGYFTLKSGQYEVARSLYLKCLQEAGGGYWEIYYKLSVSNLHLGDFSLGRLCLLDTLQLNPDNSEAREMIRHFSP